MRTVTTLFAVIGDDLESAARAVASSADNVGWKGLADASGAETPGRSASLAQAWRRALRRPSVYTLTGFDPIGEVVRQWATRLEEPGSDHLELAIGMVEADPSPDYYLVEASITAPLADWYLQHLPGLAPRRVLVVDPDARAISEALRTRPFGSGLPGLAELADSARRFVPIPTLTSLSQPTPAPPTSERLFD